MLSVMYTKLGKGLDFLLRVPQFYQFFLKYCLTKVTHIQYAMI